MTCRACGAQIADKAIVCYKCGTPTADETDRPAARRPGGTNVWAVVALIVIAALAWWLTPHTTPGSMARWGVWTALAVAGAGALLTLRRR